MDAIKLCAIASLGILLIVNSASAWTGNVCETTRREITRIRCCKMGTWQNCCLWGYCDVCSYVQEKKCCTGWTHTGDKNCNEPVCIPKCQNNGKCTRPNVCDCPPEHIGDYCEENCVSHDKPCYPGWCENKNCKCADNFSGTSCLIFNDDTLKPTIDQCRTTFTQYSRAKQMLIYNYTVDSTEATKKQIIWVNQNSFNQLNITYRVNFDYESVKDKVIPEKPSYIRDFKIGVVKGHINITQSRLPINVGDPRLQVFNKIHNCDAFSQNNPRYNGANECNYYKEDFIYNLQSGDIFTVVFEAQSGGIREVQDEKNTFSTFPVEYYTGKTENKEMAFYFDLEYPTHCSEDNSCGRDIDINPLRVEHDITETEIVTRWSGWKDDLAGVARYAWEIFKLQSDSSKHLTVPKPLQPVYTPITEILHTDSTQTYERVYTPSDPGMYCIILEVNDKANNSRYIRRFVLYDPASNISINTNNKLYVNTSLIETSHSWASVIGNGIGGTTDVQVVWHNHFANVFHETNHLLNKILEYPPQLDDGGSRGKGYKHIHFDDNEGKRTTAAIPNSHGIVKFETVSRVDKEGGIAFSETPGSGWKDVGIAENDLVHIPGISDGKSAKIFVRATDVMGNRKVDSTVVHFDSSKPNITKLPTIVNNVKEGKFPFSSRVTVYGRDEDSGIHKIHWKLIMASNGFVKMSGDVPNSKRTSEECSKTPCYFTPMEDGFFYSMTFDINHCWMRVPKDELDTLVMDLRIDVINFAMLSSTTHLNISNIRELYGIEDYSGPMNIKMTNQLDTGVSLTWEHAPSCYERDVILIVVYMPDGTKKTLRADRDAKRFDITGLDPETSYNIEMMTVYKTDGSNTIDSTISEFVIVTVEQDGLSEGAIAGIVIAILLILILIGIGILLWKTGRLEKLLGRGERSPSIRNNLHSIETSPSNNTLVNNHPKAPNNVYENKARSGNNRLSRSHDEDNIYYSKLYLKESYQIARKHVSLEDEIKRGKFAVIYRAQWYSDKPDPQTVVAKVLKENATEQDTLKMKAKINFYASEVGEHQHVLKFIGAVEDEHLGSIMLLEYCECGTLKEYLSSKQHQVTEDIQDKLFRFAFDTCKGMEYLAGRGIIHRRLAARNILLNFLHTIKISGFGPMPNEDGPDDQTERLPVKWLPPECIESSSTRDATTKCDVWSYGIVLWEIFSMGDTPYPDVRGRDLLLYLKRGERMKKPEYSDGKMYEIMKKCWRTDVGKRPPFKKILSEMESLFVTSGDDDYYYDSKDIYDNRK